MATIPIITSLTYFAIYLYKHIFVSETASRMIPVVAGVLGLLIGVVGFFVTPELFASCPTVFDAMLVGGMSGLGAVGVNQIFKQNAKGTDKPEDKKE